MGVLRFSHLGLCVSQLERSHRFYCEGLGFREASRRVERGEPSATLLGLEGLELEAVFLVRDGVCLELLHYRAPGSAEGSAPRPMNVIGLTHLSLRVEDLDAVLDRLASLGGRVLDETRIDVAERDAGAVFVTDPDGTRIELVESRDFSVTEPT